MSSSGERGPSEGLLARAKEAAKNPHLVWLVERAPSPRQAAIVCQKLRLTNGEEKNTKALAWLKEHQPEQFRKILSASEAENKKQAGGKEMRPVFLRLKGKRVSIYTSAPMNHDIVTGIVVKVGKTYVELKEGEKSDSPIFVNYSQIVTVYSS